MNMFKAALLLGTVVTVPANAQNSVPFHSGVNLSVAPGGADRSQVAGEQAPDRPRTDHAHTLDHGVRKSSG